MPRIEQSPQQIQIGRREFFGVAATTALTVFNAACTNGNKTTDITIVTQPTIELPRTKEGEMDFKLGDVVFHGNDYYLLRTGLRFLLPKSVEEYARKSRAGEFGARLSPLPKDIMEKIPIGHIPTYPLTDMTNTEKANRSIDGGGQKITFFLGFMNTLGEHWEDVASGGGVFNKIQQDVLKGLGWNIEDFLFDTHGAKGREGFPVRATMRDINENARYGMATLTRTKVQHVLEQNNVIGYSLGGLIALLAIEEHLDSINNIILLDSPLLGFPPDILYSAAGVVLSQAYGDKVVGQLLELWNSQEHRRRIRNIVTKIIKEKKGLYTWGTEKSIVPSSSSILEGTTQEVDGHKIVPLLKAGASANPIFNHGRLLIPAEAPRFMEYIRMIIKRNIT